MTTRHGIILGTLIAHVVASSGSWAQYGANHVTNRIEGGVTEWPDRYIVGSNTCGNVLAVGNGGVLSSLEGFVGFDAVSANSLASVAGAGAVWRNEGGLVVGYRGAGNRMEIADGGRVLSGTGIPGKDGRKTWNTAWVGFWSRNNSVLVTDAGSTWSNLYTCVGEWGSDNALVVSNGARVYNRDAWIGRDPGANGNRVVVTGAGSVWENDGELTIGNYGLRNSLEVNEGALVRAQSLLLGYFLQAGVGDTPPGYNEVRVDGGDLTVTNGKGNAEFRFGQTPSRVIVRGGKVTVDRLLLPEPGILAADPQYAPNRIVLDGGTLRSAGTTVSNGLCFFVGDGTATATFDMAGGKHEFNDGMCIRSNAVLAGAGTVTGSVVVEGTVRLTEGVSVFRGRVTNNGRIETENGASAVFSAEVVNNGTMAAPHGSMTLKGGITGNGVLSGNIAR